MENVRMLCSGDTIEITHHMYLRCRERNISISDVKNAIMTGRIIEDYPNAYPYPACLVLGTTQRGEFLHVVCGIGEGRLWIISAYKPDIIRWEPDFSTRKDDRK